MMIRTIAPRPSARRIRRVWASVDVPAGRLLDARAGRLPSGVDKGAGSMTAAAGALPAAPGAHVPGAPTRGPPGAPPRRPDTPRPGSLRWYPGTRLLALAPPAVPRSAAAGRRPS